MANRHLLSVEDIKGFEEYLLSKGYAIHDSKGFYEVLRASRKDRRYPVIVYKRISSNGGGKLVHYTVADRDVPVVSAFFKSKRNAKQTTYKITEIEYDIEPENVEDDINEDDYALSSDYIKALGDRVDEIEETLPYEITVKTSKVFRSSDPEYVLQEFLAEEITNRTGWLVKSFKYEKE